MNKAYLLIGGNLGDKKMNLQTALSYIEKKVGKVVRVSSVYKTAPWGFEHEEDFLNQAVLVETEKSPRQLLEDLLQIELMMGRKRDKTRWSERTMDIDILFYNEDVIEEEGLQVPHPRLHQRRFALVPMAEIAGDYVHPLFHKTVDWLLKGCGDKSAVEHYLF